MWTPTKLEIADDRAPPGARVAPGPRIRPTPATCQRLHFLNKVFCAVCRYNSQPSRFTAHSYLNWYDCVLQETFLRNCYVSLIGVIEN